MAAGDHTIACVVHATPTSSTIGHAEPSTVPAAALELIGWIASQEVS
jgi:hypothetical protein